MSTRLRMLSLIIVVFVQFSISISGVHSESQLTHGWDCVVCETNSMLAGNFGHTSSAIFNMTDQWWIETIAKSYAAVALNNWLGSQNYNGTGESGRVTVAKALKAVNPKIKVLFYFSQSWVSHDPFITNQLLAHPEWWLKDDYGNIIWQVAPVEGRKGHPDVDMTMPEVQEWFSNLAISYFKDKEEAKLYCDGMFVDGAGYRDPSRNISPSRYEKLFAGKMETLNKAQSVFTELNSGEVWGNAALESHRAQHIPESIGWNTTLQHFNGAFEEMFGSFATQNKDGTWNTTLMERSFEDIINASNAGHSIVIHAYPGPATTPFLSRGSTGNAFHVASWAGSVAVPNTTDGCRQAAAERLVESLAPFLIVANERVFLSFAWFYGVEDGYIPCKAGVQCGMPSSWYPEFTRPLGPPSGPAQRHGTVWTREFQHASVYVDLKDRHASKISWF